MILSFGDKSPRIHPSVYVSQRALIIGDVEIGEGSSIWHDVIIRGDISPIRIGRNCHIEDKALLHAYLDIGDNTVLGHGAIVEGARVGSHVLIGNQATVLGMNEIGDHCVIAACSLVRKGAQIPPYSLVAGVPGKIVETMTPERAEDILGQVLGVTLPLLKKYKELRLLDENTG